MLVVVIPESNCSSTSSSAGHLKLMTPLAGVDVEESPSPSCKPGFQAGGWDLPSALRRTQEKFPAKDAGQIKTLCLSEVAVQETAVINAYCVPPHPKACIARRNGSRLSGRVGLRSL
ncbi:hypothetical protein N0V93_001083 [Gnomoniopsis smithogilvyi]|uniref:Uncharacterized protein n=1 Tax=Gnomoniopsis smithogilvyi TaxID=1191159 RepID=A0A9W9D2E2_9PEZI|nr:hypothetical protein N0V93_001083 [Gnomoniopsis smithogilvyi]